MRQAVLGCIGLSSDIYGCSMNASEVEAGKVMHESLLYKEFMAERDEILKHKWIESEKAGYDIGFERALIDWLLKCRSSWREQRQKH